MMSEGDAYASRLIARLQCLHQGEGESKSSAAAGYSTSVTKALGSFLIILSKPETASRLRLISNTQTARLQQFATQGLSIEFQQEIRTKLPSPF